MNAFEERPETLPLLPAGSPGPVAPPSRWPGNLTKREERGDGVARSVAKGEPQRVPIGREANKPDGARVGMAEISKGRSGKSAFQSYFAVVS